MKTRGKEKIQRDLSSVVELKKLMLQAALEAKEGHVASGFSILDILWVLYTQILKVSPRSPRNLNRDRFILSKGHASLALYAVLAKKKFISEKELSRFCEYDSILGGHPSRTHVPGVETSTGSLGHGMPMAVGIALSLKIQKKNPQVYVLIGDGESNEGTIWESALLAAHHKLDNICCIVDHNHSTDRALNVDDLAKKFEAFGWKVHIIDGHNHKQIKKALTSPHRRQPMAIIAQTIKGMGIKEMEQNPAWHHRAPTLAEYEAMAKELSAQLKNA